MVKLKGILLTSGFVLGAGLLGAGLKLDDGVKNYPYYLRLAGVAICAGTLAEGVLRRMYEDEVL